MGSGAFGHHGSAVALNGDGTLLVVGAVDASDLAQIKPVITVYARTNNTRIAPWVRLASLPLPFTATTPSTEFLRRSRLDGAVNISLALSSDGRTLVVGVPFAQTTQAGVALQGVVALFRATSWGFATFESSVLVAPTPNAALFGVSVAISRNGKYVAVGAPNLEFPEPPSSPTNLGFVAVYIRPSSLALSLETTINANSDGLVVGSSVALSDEGGLVLVAADVRSFSIAPRILTFVRMPEYGTWLQETLPVWPTPSASYVVRIANVAIDRVGLTMAFATSVMGENHRVFVATRPALGMTWSAPVSVFSSVYAYGGVVAISDAGSTVVTSAKPVNNAGDVVSPWYRIVKDASKPQGWADAQGYVYPISPSRGSLQGSCIAINSNGGLVAVGAPNADSFVGSGAGGEEVGAVSVWSC